MTLHPHEAEEWFEFALPLRLTESTATEDIQQQAASLLEFGARRLYSLGCRSILMVYTRGWICCLHCRRKVQMCMVFPCGVGTPGTQGWMCATDLVHRLKGAGLWVGGGVVISMNAALEPQSALQRQIELGLGAGLVMNGSVNPYDNVFARFGILRPFHLWIRIVPASPQRDGAVPISATAQDHIQMVALCRTLLSHVQNQWAVWMLGARVIAQQALLSGCNGLGTVLLEEGSEREAWEKRKLRWVSTLTIQGCVRLR